MVLLHHVVEILDLADFDRGVVLGIIALDCRFIGLVAINGDRFRNSVTVDRLVSKLSRTSVPRCFVSRKLMACLHLSTARYKYRHTHFTLI
jgi:hypothetical protein